DVGDVRIEVRTVVERGDEALVDLLGEALAHDALVEDVASEEAGDPRGVHGAVDVLEVPGGGGVDCGGAGGGEAHRVTPCCWNAATIPAWTVGVSGDAGPRCGRRTGGVQRAAADLSRAG